MVLLAIFQHYDDTLYKHFIGCINMRITCMRDSNIKVLQPPTLIGEESASYINTIVRFAIELQSKIYVMPKCTGCLSDLNVDFADCRVVGANG